jgi:hypothetical protein
MKLTQRLSLRVRLTLIFLILASATWAVSSFVAWQTTDNVDELFDTQLMLFAKRLSTLDISDVTTSSNMARTPKKRSMAILMTTHWRLPSTPPTAKWCYTMAIMARIFPTATAGRV